MRPTSFCFLILYTPALALGHRIVAVWPARAAAQNPLTGKQKTFEEAILLECFYAVLGARWLEAAGRREQGRKHHLITANKKNSQLSWDFLNYLPHLLHSISYIP